ncbi:MAG: hypothetical protein NTZ38_02250, partial [Candidatus Taylorbacteria bacterium]|nr:hypothetical protein [Candidatus Taylorbacteria bacterium]
MRSKTYILCFSLISAFSALLWPSQTNASIFSVGLITPADKVVATSSTIMQARVDHGFSGDNRNASDFTVNFYYSATSTGASPVLIGTGTVTGATTSAASYYYSYDWNATNLNGIYYVWTEAISSGETVRSIGRNQIFV